LAGEKTPDVQLLDQRLDLRAVFMSPVVLSALLSAPNMSQSTRSALETLPRLDVTVEFWVRAGLLRRRLMAQPERYKPKLADTLIAQLCLDYSIPLLTRDSDFEPFARLEGLRLEVA